VTPWGAAAFIGSFVLAVYDATFTVRRMRKYGLLIETNSLVTYLATTMGELGVYVGALVPTLLLSTAAVLFDSSLAIGTIFGVRLCLFQFQRISLRLEPAIDDALRGGDGSKNPSLTAKPPEDE
jgi:hypothetical protein